MSVGAKENGNANSKNVSTGLCEGSLFTGSIGIYFNETLMHKDFHRNL